jgi:CRISPR-associated protein Csm1
MILVPAGTEDTLEELQETINRELLKEFKGDLELCLAYEAVSRDHVRGEAFGNASSALKRKMARQKHRPFGKLAQSDWRMIFAPQGTGGLRYCTITQRELGDDEPAIPLPDAAPEPGGALPVMSRQTCGFIGLAEEIGVTQSPLMVISKEKPPPLTIDDSSDYNLYKSYLPYWRNLLWKVTGWQYDFVVDKKDITQRGTVYAINAPDFLSKRSDGFLFLGNVTPHISEADLKWSEETYPDDTSRRKEEFIKDFELMGRQAVGIKRVGVLRMDVDDLGRAAVEGLEPQTMARVSTFSQFLELFFAGWLNEICEDIQASDELLPEDVERHPTDILYIIYSGGDDLFVVGAWDRLPLLSERIHHDFAAFTGHNPVLHISAGLTLEQRKFPLYRAAERAHDALDGGAKIYSRPEGGSKDAIAYLGQVFPWEDFTSLGGEDQFSVKEATNRLIGLLESGVSRSLLQIVQSIYGQYRRDRDRNLKRRPACEPTDEQLYYGNWMWMQAYQIQRLIARQKDEEVKEAIKQLQKDLMDPQNVRYSGLAARWAEYLTRKER